MKSNLPCHPTINYSSFQYYLQYITPSQNKTCSKNKSPSRQKVSTNDSNSRMKVEHKKSVDLECSGAGWHLLNLDSIQNIKQYQNIEGCLKFKGLTTCIEEKSAK